MIQYGRDDCFNDAVKESTKRLDGGPIVYARAKPAFARDFCERMDSEDLDVLDLRERLEKLVALIRGWNEGDLPLSGARPDDSGRRRVRLDAAANTGRS